MLDDPRRADEAPVAPLVLGLLLLIGCDATRDAVESVHLAGSTMGTTYHVTVVPAEGGLGADQLGRRIEARLEAVNASMSTWRPDSEISRFNTLPSGEILPISDDFRRVVARALELAALSGGAFDPTVMPLVELWGFGPEVRSEPPTEEELAAASALVGFRRIELTEDGLRKSGPARLDLSAIAKGYGVDAVCEVIAAAGHQDYLVEIGGEVRGAGTNPRGQPWQIGIDRPNVSRQRDGTVQRIIGLSDRALATSGDYRNFRDHDGQRYSHTIDPRTGHPVTHGLASVSVVAPTCMDADALATAISVLGADAGLPLVESLSGIEAYCIIRDPGGTLHESRTSGFTAIVVR